MVCKSYHGIPTTKKEEAKEEFTLKKEVPLLGWGDIIYCIS